MFIAIGSTWDVRARILWRLEGVMTPQFYLFIYFIILSKLLRWKLWREVAKSEHSLSMEKWWEGCDKKSWCKTDCHWSRRLYSSLQSPAQNSLSATIQWMIMGALSCDVRIKFSESTWGFSLTLEGIPGGVALTNWGQLINFCGVAEVQFCLMMKPVGILKR